MQCCLVFVSVHNEYSHLTQSANSACANKSIGRWCDNATPMEWKTKGNVSREHHENIIALSPHRQSIIVIAPSQPSSWLHRTIVIELSGHCFIDPNLDGAMVNYVALSGFQTEYNLCVRIWISYLNHLFSLYYFLILSVNWVFSNFLLENICFHDGNVSFPMTYR